LFRLHNTIKNIGKTESELASETAQTEEPERSPRSGGADVLPGSVDAAEGPRAAIGPEDETSENSTVDKAEGNVEDVSRFFERSADGNNDKAEEDTRRDWELFKARVSPSVEDGSEATVDDEPDIWENMDSETRKVFMRTMKDVPLARTEQFTATVKKIMKRTETHTADAMLARLQEVYKRQFNDANPETIRALRTALTAEGKIYQGDRPLSLADAVVELLPLIAEKVNKKSEVDYWKTLKKLSTIKF
jgi:hypothetical protein